MRVGPWMAVIVVATALAGCLAGEPTGDESAADNAAFDPCRHPWPCGDGSDWPVDLMGPFGIAVDRAPIELTSHDGTVLRGWLTLPDVPAGTPLPTIISSSPYHGLDLGPGDGGPDADAWGDGPVHFWAEHGFAFVSVAVRGTGPSGGCFENKGLNEQLDQVAVVEWAAAQDWSNGRIGMIGISYPGTTPFMAAIHGPAALKTVVPIGPVTDVYTEMHTPQGALYTTGGANEAARRAAVTGAANHWVDWLPAGDPTAPASLADRVCPAVAQVLLEAQSGHAQDRRDAEYWRERQFILGFPNITSSVYLIHGLQETAHPFQEDVVWQALNAPRRALFGQWDHETPTNDGWEADIVAWMDFWLKGLGAPPSVGRVDYETLGGAWATSTAWPPAAAKEEAFALGGDLVGPVQFHSLPQPPTAAPHAAAKDTLCNGPVAGPRGPVAAVVRSELATADALLAGNPYALLEVLADEPGGQIAVHLFRVPGNCGDAVLLGHGVADLRFHEGSMTGTDFPVGEATTVRVDILNFAAELAAGDQVAAVFSFGDSFSTTELANPLSDDRHSRSGQAYYPTITIADDSWLVLPFVSGSFGLDEPPRIPPPRPFAPIAST